jgi:hypothetical protein
MKTIQKIVLATVALAFAAAHSAFAVTNVQLSVQGSDVVLQWPSLPCQTFIIGHRSTLNTATPWTLRESALVASPGAFTTNVHLGAVGSMGFYFVAEHGEDSDGDGLRNRTELSIGLNLLRADSDGDTISDGNEDLDGDGVTNFDEMLSGTPLNVANGPWPPPLLPFGAIFYREETFTLSCASSGAFAPAGGGGDSQDLLAIDVAADMVHGVTAVEVSPGVLNVKFHSIYIGPEFGVFSPQAPNPPSPQNPFPTPSAEQLELLARANGEIDVRAGEVGIVRPAMYDLLTENTLDWARWQAEYGIRQIERSWQLIESGQQVATEAEYTALRARWLTQCKRIEAATKSLARRFGRAIGRYAPFIGGIMILATASATAEQWNTALQDYATDIRNGDDTTGSAAIIAALSNDLAPGAGNIVLNALLR